MPQLLCPPTDNGAVRIVLSCTSNCMISPGFLNDGLSQTSMEKSEYETLQHAENFKSQAKLH